MSFFQISLSLFLILNSLGNIPLFIALLGRYEVKRQRRIIVRELLIALFILLLFNYFGDNIMEMLGISHPIIGIAGGVLLLIIALGMIFPSSTQRKITVQEPLIVPLAMPVIAGPGSIAAVMVYSEQCQNPSFIAAAIIVAWLPTAIILFASSSIKHLLGEKGLIACERLGGMLICLIAVKMLSNGTISLLKTIF